MKILRGILIGAIVLGMLALVALTGWVLLGGAEDMSRDAMPTRRTASSKLLYLGAGSGDEVSADFTVPAGCSRQELSYSGTALNDEVSWVNFRAVDADGRGQGSVGPADLLDAPDGRGLLTLEPGRYAIEVEAWEASWRYELTCR